jgi:hypothetical protein
MVHLELNISRVIPQFRTNGDHATSMQEGLLCLNCHSAEFMNMGNLREGKD